MYDHISSNLRRRSNTFGTLDKPLRPGDEHSAPAAAIGLDGQATCSSTDVRQAYKPPECELSDLLCGSETAQLDHSSPVQPGEAGDCNAAITALDAHDIWQSLPGGSTSRASIAASSVAPCELSQHSPASTVDAQAAWVSQSLPQNKIDVASPAEPLLSPPQPLPKATASPGDECSAALPVAQEQAATVVSPHDNSRSIHFGVQRSLQLEAPVEVEGGGRPPGLHPRSVSIAGSLGPETWRQSKRRIFSGRLMRPAAASEAGSTWSRHRSSRQFLQCWATCLAVLPALRPSALLAQLLWTVLSLATAPIYVCAALFVACTVMHLAALGRKIARIAAVRFRAQSRGPALSTAHSMATTRTTMSRMSSAVAFMSVSMAGSTLTADAGRRRRRPSGSRSMRSDMQRLAPGGLLGGAAEEPLRIWGFPHLDTDSTMTLVKRAILWEAGCAAGSVISLIATAAGAVVRVVLSPAEVAARHMWEQFGLNALPLHFHAKPGSHAAHTSASASPAADPQPLPGHGPSAVCTQEDGGATSAETGDTKQHIMAPASGAPRAFRKLLLMLPPDATLLIYMYFLLLLYLSAAALYLFLVPGPSDSRSDTRAQLPHTAAAATSPTTPAATLSHFAHDPAVDNRPGLEASIWLPVASMLRALSGAVDMHAAASAAAAADLGTLLIGVFLVSLGLPLVLLVWVTASNPASSTILHPSKFMRPTVSNLLVLSATVAEAVQLSASSFQVSAPQPAYMRRFFRAFMLDIGRSRFEAATWVAIALVAVWASFVGAGLQALDTYSIPAAAQGRAAAEGKRPLHAPLRVVIAQNLHQIMTGPLFLVTVSRLTAVLDCTAVPEPARSETGTPAVLDTSLTYHSDSDQPAWGEGRGLWVPCFEGSHREQLAATMLGLLFFLPSATMASAYFEDAQSSKRDARTVPVFLHIDRVVKCFAVAVSELFGSKPLVYLPALLAADLCLLALNALFSPCCVPTINVIKNIAYAYASWTVMVSLAFTALTSGRAAPLPAWLFVLAMFGVPLAVAAAVALVRHGGSAAVHTSRPVRAKLQRAAAAAIACNRSPTARGGRASHGAGRTAAPQRARSWGAFATLGLLQSPLRERIHLERLVFLSCEHCATQPELVADVILQVATHCATAVASQPERTAKLAQKFVRAGALRPICALLALSVPRRCTVDAAASPLESARPPPVRVVPFDSARPFAFPPVATRISRHTRRACSCKAAVALEKLLLSAVLGPDGVWAAVAADIAAHRGGLPLHILAWLLVIFAAEEGVRIRTIGPDASLGRAPASRGVSIRSVSTLDLSASLLRRGKSRSRLSLGGSLSSSKRISAVFAGRTGSGKVGAAAVGAAPERPHSQIGFGVPMAEAAVRSGTKQVTVSGDTGSETDSLLNALEASGTPAHTPAAHGQRQRQSYTTIASGWTSDDSDGSEAAADDMEDGEYDVTETGLHALASCMALLVAAPNADKGRWLAKLVQHGLLAATVTAADELLGKSVNRMWSDISDPGGMPGPHAPSLQPASPGAAPSSSHAHARCGGAAPAAVHRSAPPEHATLPHGNGNNTSELTGGDEGDERAGESDGEESELFAGKAGNAMPAGRVEAAVAASPVHRADSMQHPHTDSATANSASADGRAADQTAATEVDLHAPTVATAAPALSPARPAVPAAGAQAPSNTASPPRKRNRDALSSAPDSIPGPLMPVRATRGHRRPFPARGVSAATPAVYLPPIPSSTRCAEAAACHVDRTGAPSGASQAKDVQLQPTVPGEAAGDERHERDSRPRGAADGRDPRRSSIAMVLPPGGLSTVLKGRLASLASFQGMRGGSGDVAGPHQLGPDTVNADAGGAAVAESWLDRAAPAWSAGGSSEARSMRSAAHASLYQEAVDTQVLAEVHALLVSVLVEVLAAPESGGMAALCALLRSGRWSVRAEGPADGPPDAPLSGHVSSGWLARLTGMVARKADGLVQAAQSGYDAAETLLGVLMLKCLRPLGVRDASEELHRCPHVSQVSADVAPACRVLPHVLAAIAASPPVRKLPMQDALLLALLRLSHLQACSATDATAAASPFSAHSDSSSCDESLSDSASQAASPGLTGLAGCGSQHRRAGARRRQGLLVGLDCARVVPDPWADDTALDRLLVGIANGRDIASASALHALASVYRGVREFLVQHIVADEWTDSGSTDTGGPTLALSGITVCLEMDLLLDETWPVFGSLHCCAAAELVAVGLLEGLKGALSKFQGPQRLLALQAVVLVSHQPPLVSKLISEGMLETSVLALETAVRDLSRAAPAALTQRAAAPQLLSQPRRGRASRTRLGTNHSVTDPGSRAIRSGDGRASRAGTMQRGPRRPRSSAASSVLHRAKPVGGGHTETAAASAVQHIQAATALAASTAVAALELVSLLSHSRAVLRARRDFQRLIASFAEEYQAGALVPSASVGDGSGSRQPPQRGPLQNPGDASVSCSTAPSDHNSRSGADSDTGSADSALPQHESLRGSLSARAALRRGSGGPTGSLRSWSGLSAGSGGSSVADGFGGRRAPVSRALRTRLLRHLLKGPTIKLLCAAAALQQAAPAYNCSVQQRTAALLRTWAFCAPDIARELVVTPYLLCKLLGAFLPIVFEIPDCRTALDAAGGWRLRGHVADADTRMHAEASLAQLASVVAAAHGITTADIDSVPKYFPLLLKIFSGQMQWADIAARTLDPPVAQHNSEWQVLEVLLHWPWDRLVVSRAGMGVVQARALGISLAMSVARGRAPLELICNGTIHSERLASGSLDNAGKQPLGREEAILLAGYLSVPSPGARPRAHEGLRRLSLVNSTVAGTGIAALADSLQSNTSLHSLDLVGSQMAGAGCRSLAKMLTRNTALRHLSVFWAGADHGALAALATALAANTTLTSLALGEPRSLSAAQATRAAVAVLSSATSHLRRLEFSYITIPSPADAAGFCAALRRNVGVVELCLPYLAVKYGSAQPDGVAIAGGSAELLDEGGGLEDGGGGLKGGGDPHRETATEADAAVLLGHALQCRGATLRSLELPFMHVRSGAAAHAAVVLGAVHQATVLTRLDLLQVSLTDADWQAATSALSRCATLACLRLSHPLPPQSSTDGTELFHPNNHLAPLHARGIAVDASPWLHVSEGGFRPRPWGTTDEVEEAAAGSMHMGLVPQAQAEFEADRQDKAALQESMQSSTFSQGEARRAVDALRTRTGALQRELQAARTAAAEAERMAQQTRKDLHARHAREREVLQAQIETLQKASAVASLPDVMKQQAVMEVSRLKQENEGLQAALRAAQRPVATADALADLQAEMVQLKERHKAEVASVRSAAQREHAAASDEGKAAQLQAALQAAEEKAAELERRLHESQAEAAASVPGGASTMALLRKVRTLEAQLLDEQTRRAAATAAAADAAASHAAAAEAVALREQLADAERVRAQQAEQLQLQSAEASRAEDLEALLARYRAVGDLEHVAHLAREAARLAAYEGQYRTLLESYDREVAAAAAAAEEAAAARGRDAARAEMQAELEAERAQAAAKAEHERARTRGRIERLEQRLEDKVALIATLRKAGAS
eukprot:jgi/Ulvmu1/6763/UM030_0099.1